MGGFCGALVPHPLTQPLPEPLRFLGLHSGPLSLSPSEVGAGGESPMVRIHMLWASAQSKDGELAKGEGARGLVTPNQVVGQTV